MPDWYCSREELKAAFDLPTDVRDTAIDIAIAEGSRAVDALLGRRDGAFIPRTQTRYYRWDPPTVAPTWRLWLDEWLISLTGLTGESGAVTIPVGDVFLEPVNEGPPYTWLEVDQSSSDASARFSAGNTRQRAIAVTGSWGFQADTVAAGTVQNTTEISESGTSLKLSDGDLVEVGHPLLIEDEQLFVSEKTGLGQGTVTATVERGVNGTTAVTHATNTPIYRYRVPDDVRQLALAEALASNVLFLRGYQESVQPPLNASGRRGTALQTLRDKVRKNPRYQFREVG